MSELCALNVTDIDRYGVAMLIVWRGKDGKSRQVLIGRAADRTVAAYLAVRA